MPIFAVSVKGVCFTCRSAVNMAPNIFFQDIFFEMINTDYKLLKKKKEKSLDLTFKVEYQFNFNLQQKRVSNANFLNSFL